MSYNEYLQLESIKSDLKHIVELLESKEFNIFQYAECNKRLVWVQEYIDSLKIGLEKMSKQINTENWRLFIESLPVLNDKYIAGQTFVDYGDNTWEKDSEEDICEHRSTVYKSKGEDGLLYVFAGGYYLDEKTWGRIDSINMERMGFSDRTEYVRTDNGVKAVSSGYINFSQMYLDKSSNVDDYLIPIIDRG